MSIASGSAEAVVEPLLSLSAITKRFGSFSALSDVSLDIRPGEIHCILGENGAGKSTLCNVIFGVHRPDGGAMSYRGLAFQPSGPADSLAQGIAMVLVTDKLAEIKKIADRVTVLRGGRVVATSDKPAADIDALVRAMIQGDVNTLDTSAAASILGLEPVRHVGHEHATTKAKVEALQINGLTVKDYQGVTRLDNFTLTVDRGEIVGVAGVEGNGHEELTAEPADSIP